jgi:putative flippase GtrA
MRALRLRSWQLRILKFSLVGAVGIAVQFVVLCGLVKAHVNYLVATALAVESALVHNFVWHQQFTWSDQLENRRFANLNRFFRFHLSNGAISLIGNLVIMRLLVGGLGFPVVVANGFAISICFAANFMVSDQWVFSLATNAVSAERVAGAIRPISGDRASTPACALRREHRQEQRLQPGPDPARSVEQAEMVTVPTIHPKQMWE